MKLIDKDALVAEIENRIKELQNLLFIEGEEKTDFIQKTAILLCIDECKVILSIIDTLEVKEVNLEKEIENLIEKEKAFVTNDREVKYYNGDSFNHIYELEFIARHFFELGLKVQKGEKV